MLSTKHSQTICLSTWIRVKKQSMIPLSNTKARLVNKQPNLIRVVLEDRLYWSKWPTKFGARFVAIVFDGQNRRFLTLLQQQEEKNADEKKWSQLRKAQARRKQAQEDLKRKLILNNEKRAKRIRAHNSPGTSMETERHVMIYVEPEETFETASPQIKDEVAGESSQQQTFHKLDNSFYSGETVDDENDAALDQQFVEEQRLFQEESIALQRESVALQKAILEALQQLNLKVNEDQQIYLFVTTTSYLHLKLQYINSQFHNKLIIRQGLTYTLNKLEE